VVALAVVLIARGGGGSGDGGSGAEAPSHKVLPQPKAKAPARRKTRPAGPHGAGWSVFEDHTALVRDGPARRQQTLDELRTLGADTLRVEVKWNEVAPSPARARRPRFDPADPGRYPGFAAYDDLFRRATAMGFRVIADLAPDAPRWATAGGRGYAATANLGVRPAEFGSFAGAVAKRYSGAYRGLPRVAWFSVWNEPNHRLFMKPVEQGPDRYRAMVRAAVPAIRAGAAAGTRVLVGETAPAGRPGTSLGPREFMQRFLCLDTGWRPVTTGDCAGFGRLVVDGWAHHPYGPVDVVPAGRDIVNMLAIRRLGAYLDRAAAAGRLPRRLPIYDTEFGLQSNPPDPTVTTSLAKQAEQLNQKEELSWRYPRLRSYAQYLLWDDPQRPGPRDVAWSGFQTGLRFGQGPAKPAWNAYRLPLVVHRGGRGVRIWGRVRPGNGRRPVQLRVRGSTGWRDAGRPLKTDAAGFFTAGRRDVGAYRFRAAGIGLSRVAEPVG
jgi:Cellulase (glycosyl hydrolase family 5)